MLPRKSSVLKYVGIATLGTVVLFLWTSNSVNQDGDSLWRQMVDGIELIGVNETQLRMEFDQLKHVVNSSYTAHNKSIEQIYHYVKAMRRDVPVNPHNFRYIINPTTVCHGKAVFLLGYVHTAPEHYKRRNMIREMWGNPKNFPDKTFRLVFVLGRSLDQRIQAALQFESDLYGDLVQEDFLDSYRNLTYKAISALRWITGHCPNATFILKTDDDIFVNIFNLMNHLQSYNDIHQGGVNKLLLCLVWHRMKVIRDSKSKWYLSKTEFKPDYFPTYCSGSAYIMSTDVAMEMYNASMKIPFFWVDDYYVTGLLAEKVGVKHTKFNSAYTLGPNTFLQKFTEKNKWQNLVFGHVHNLNQATHVWSNIMKLHGNVSSKS